MSVPAGAYFAVGAGKPGELDNAARRCAPEKPTLEQAGHNWFNAGARVLERRLQPGAVDLKFLPFS
jgi:hypothetical protein